MKDNDLNSEAAYLVRIPGNLASCRLVIPGRLPGLNEYTNDNRSNRHKGAAMKKDAQEVVQWCIMSQLQRVRFDKPVFLLFTFYEKDRRRDHDNVSSFARKVIQDALVACKVLKDDGWDQVTGYLDQFRVDPKHPRITVQFIVQEEKQCKKAQSTK